MAIGVVCPPIILQFFGNNGEPAVGGSILTQVGGVNAATYQDVGLTTPLPNPIPLNSRGEISNASGLSCQLFLTPNTVYVFTMFDANGNQFDQASYVNGIQQNQSSIGAALYPQTAAETFASVTPVFNYPYGNMLRYGLVANSSGAAATNTAILQTLFNPVIMNGPTGRFWFPNTSGTDVYSFSSVIPIRDGVSIDLGGCTLSYTGALAVGDTGSGFLFSRRDFELFNGTIIVAVDTTLTSSAGFAIQTGARGDDSAYFPGSYDSLMATPQGNIHLHDLHIIINNTGTTLSLSSTGGIQMTGGLQNVRLDNISIDGSTTAGLGISYEFGWATSGTTNLRQTSHAHNMKWTNIRVQNLTAVTSIAAVLAGAYNASIDGLYCNAVGGALSVTPGESLNYRPWASVDAAGVKKNIALKNIVGQAFTGTGIFLAGAQPAAGGYLSAIIAALGHPGDYLAETDLYSFSLDGFALDGSGNVAGNGEGILLQGSTRADIRNGSVFGGFGVGINATDETNAFVLDKVGVHGCTTTGVSLGGFGIWNPARRGKAEIRHCYIAGNGTATAGTYPGISIGVNWDSVVIEHNRLNYDAAFHGTDETTQAQAVSMTTVGLGSSNVICRYNHVGVIAGAGVAFYNINVTPPSLGCLLESNTGVATYSGLWDGVVQTATIALTAAVPGDLAVTYTVAKMDYIKRGQLIDYSFAISTSAFTYTTATGIVKITGFPYASSGALNTLPCAALQFSGVTKAGYTQFAPYIAGAATFLSITCCGSAQTETDMLIGDLPTTGAVKLRGTGQYFTTS